MRSSFKIVVASSAKHLQRYRKKQYAVIFLRIFKLIIIFVLNLFKSMGLEKLTFSVKY